LRQKNEPERFVEELMSMREKSVGTGSKTGRPLRVLVVEDSQLDAELLVRALSRGGFDLTWDRVDTGEAMEESLGKHDWDVILCDHAMPRFSAPEALELLKRHNMDVPFIIVSGYIEEETAVAAMKAGAHDYIMKDRLARLVPAVERELRDAQVRRARTKSDEELRRAHELLEERVEQRTAALKAANLKLENVIEERKRLENELLEIAENERRRIGFDLHDDLGQKLTGMALMMKGLERRLAAESHSCLEDAGKIHSLMQDIITHTHNLARQFSSMDIKGDDLSMVLKDLSANVKKLFAIPCGLTVKGKPPTLLHNATVQLYKIAQEAVSNAIKHGKASQVTIGLGCNDENLVMTVKNDGLPFVQPSGNSTRMGLRIMHYRANTIGAQLEIRALGQNGTLVSCTLPHNVVSAKSQTAHDRGEKQVMVDRAEELQTAGAAGL
jgi:signal transduction histidine kinase